MPDMRMRLGRKFVPDNRDWTLGKLHAKLDAADWADPDIDETLRHALESASPYYTTWVGIRALWVYIKAHLLHPKPGPTPTPQPAIGQWTDPVVLDQGNYGTCVGNGWAGWGDSEPFEDKFDEIDARKIYYEATVLDGTPDDPDAAGGGQVGSTVRSGAKAMQGRKRLTAYAFAGNMDDIDHWLDNHGPVVMGTDWTNSMFSPSPTGQVKPTGGVAGGHCWLVIHRVINSTLYECVNSWGTSWGDKGHFRIDRSDLGLLLKGIESPGEACLATELPL